MGKFVHTGTVLEITLQSESLGSSDLTRKHLTNNHYLHSLDPLNNIFTHQDFRVVWGP